MKLFRELIGDCERKMVECGFNLPKIEYKLNGRLSRKIGCCKRVSGKYVIELSTKHYIGYVTAGNMAKIVDTLLHEMCHAMPGGFNHGEGWLRYVRVINRKYNMNIKRLAPIDEVISKMLEDTHVDIYCESCKNQAKLSRRSKAFKNLNNYHCNKCGGKLRFK